MRSERHGKHTSGIEVANISRHGFWLLLDDSERFVPFKDFPWFEQAPVGQLLNVQRPHSGHLYWPDLDVDLAIESIEHPERFPLVSRARPGRPRQRASGGSRSRRAKTDGAARRR